VAILVASSLMIMSGPVSNALMPRMTNLQAQGKAGQLLDVYHKATQLIVVTAAPVALVLAFFPHQVLWAWTGNLALANKVAPVLRLYAIGYGILTIGAFPYYLQYAKGNLRLHLIGNIFFAVVLIPAIVWSAINYGMIGTGWAWLVSNVVYFIVWPPLVHHRFAPHSHLGWLLRDIGAPISLAVLVGGGVAWSGVVESTQGRLLLAGELLAVGALLVMASCISAQRLDPWGRFGLLLRKAKACTACSDNGRSR
jgi:O-antigen/teichoic acid export membrane protein